MLLYGAGGHAKVVYECLLSRKNEVQAVFDNNKDLTSFFGVKVFNRYNPEVCKDDKLIISIGSNRTRLKISRIVHHDYGTIRHNTAYISSLSEIGQGSVINANSVVQADVKVGNHVIINSGAIIEHDSIISNFSHVGPGSVICGGVSIGEGALIGANATILPGVSVGDWAIVGAGSVVLRNVEKGLKVAGNPAWEIKS